jgi:hypothetical protein
MDKFISYLKKEKFVWLLVLYFVLVLIFGIINNRFYLPDFAVYYHASKNFINGEQVYYQVFGTTGTGIYKYSPFVLIFFIPFAILPEIAARFIYFWIIAAGIIFIMFYLEQFLTKYFAPQQIHIPSRMALFFTFLVVVVHFHRELELGNVNLLLLLILIYSLSLILRNKEIPAGLLIGITILFKPHFLLLLPLLLLRKKWLTFIAVVLFIIFGLLFPFVIVGWQGNLDLHTDWVQNMLEHNTSYRLAENPNTIHHWLYIAGLKYLLSSPGLIYTYSVIFALGLLFLLGILRNYEIEKQIDTDIKYAHFLFEFILILAIIPNITYTDTEHFLLSLPIVMFILIIMINHNQPQKVIWYISIVGFFMYGGNWYEVWGDRLSIWLEHSGILGLGNVIIMSCTICYLERWRLETINQIKKKEKVNED